MNKLIVPVYLNQKIVFDLLAMLQDGLSTVTAVTKSSAHTESNNEKMSASFGLNQVLSTLLKIDLSGSKEKSGGSSESGYLSEERVHTPASLFFKLRSTLKDEGLLEVLDSNSKPKPGDIIEFEGVLKINPILETVDAFIELTDMAEVFHSEPPTNAKNAKKISENKKAQKNKMFKLSETLKGGNTIDLTSEKLLSGHKAVVTVDVSFLNDPMMSDLVDGQFKVMGKVIKTVDSTESISLIRKTTLSKMPPNIIEENLRKIGSLGDSFNIPKIEWKVEGPALQIIPIAVYA